VAVRALSVLEAQYQNAVRLEINNLYTAYIDVLAARETLRFTEASVEGLDRVLNVTRALYTRATLTRPDLDRVVAQKEAAELGVQEARQMVQSAKRSLGVLLSVPPQQADTLELRGTIATSAPAIDQPDELVRQALEVRPDLIAQRLDIQRAVADVRLAHSNQLADVYLLYQPYTFQSNAPFGLKSPTSWALGVTVPVPIFNRNQGGILRAELNVTQTQIQSGSLEYQIANEVTQAGREYAVSRALVKHFEESVLPSAQRMLEDGLRMYRTGERDAFAYFRFQRDYNLQVRLYRDALVRHRRSMLALNTAVGQRVLP
jgi:cobalt-zinc-cadmium efflux system outer membrane protein